jgi:protein O-GlcNAc transferase
MDRYMDQHQQIDIALDPFPYPGGTTSCDALWMGTPVVTMTGQTAVSRSGASILKTLGLDELVTHTRSAYIEAAVSLANDVSKLAALRSSLRDRMQGSILMNAPIFTQNMEAAFTEMWKNQYKTSAKHG